MAAKLAIDKKQSATSSHVAGCQSKSGKCYTKINFDWLKIDHVDYIKKLRFKMCF